MRTAVPRLVQILGTAALAVGLALGATPAASAVPPSERAPLPVPYTFLSGADNELRSPLADPPGANDWSCRPEPDKPNPVVLVHGTFGSDNLNWATYAPLLHNEGYCVFSLHYGNVPNQPWPLDRFGGLMSIPDHNAPQVAGFVEEVLEATGAEQADLIGHSQGTLNSAHVAKYLLPGRIGTVVSIAPLWDGTGGRGISNLRDTLPPDQREAVERGPVFESLGQMSTGSQYLADLRGESGLLYAPGVRYVNLVTRYDQVILPYTSGIVEAPAPEYDVTNITVQDGCEENYSDHLSIAGEPRTADFALNALDPARDIAPRCELVVPIHGPAGGPSSGSADLVAS